MSIGVLSAHVSVHHILAWYPGEARKECQSPRNRVTDGYNCHSGTGNLTQLSDRITSVLNV